MQATLVEHAVAFAVGVVLAVFIFGLWAVVP